MRVASHGCHDHQAATVGFVHAVMKSRDFRDFLRLSCEANVTVFTCMTGVRLEWLYACCSAI